MRVLRSIRESLSMDCPNAEGDSDFVDRHAALVGLVDDLILEAEGRSSDYLCRPCGGGLLGPSGQQGWGEAAARSMAARRASTLELYEALQTEAQAAAAAVTAEEARRWREWVSEDLAAGASRAHAYTRLPQEAVAEAVEVGDGGMSSSPDALLASQRDKYVRLWHPAQEPFSYEWQGMEELPLLTPQQLRDAASTFKRRTAITYDGFHPRSLGNLSDGSLLALSFILQAVEVSGRWPRQLRLVVTALLAKPKGGYRPIGILPAAYRLWAKTRRAWADRWEEEHARPYLSSAKGNGSLDTLWRMAARQEAGTAEGDQAAVVAEDLAAFFETVSRDRLMAEAAALGYPPALLRGALAAYSSARMLTLHGRVAREVHPTVGVIAGCSLAMSLTKLLYLRELDGVAARLPPTLALDIHVDDVTISGIGPPHVVARDIVKAHGDLREAMERLGCRFADAKTSITATTRRLASQVASRLGVEGGISSASCILGVDSTAGGRRSRLRVGSKKGARLKAAMARRKRLDNLRRAVGSRASKVFRTGILPAAAYDSPIWGVSDAEVARMRRLAAVALSPRGRGRSLAMLHLWHGLPTAAVEVAPVIHFSKMVWRATTRRTDAAARGASLADIRRMWDASRPRFEPLAQSILEARGADGTVPAAVARKAWAGACGPLAAAALSLARVGWSFNGPFELKDANGDLHQLTTASPAMVKDLMCDAVRQSLELKVGAKLAAQDPAFVGRRACVDLAVTAAKPGPGTTRHHAAIFRSVACGAVWTAVVAQERGYVSDGLCPLCGGAPDTIRHRVYFCPRTADTVAAAVPRWFLTEAASDRATSPFWTTAVFPHPADTVPRPRVDMYCEVERCEGLERVGGPTAEAGANTKVTGSVYIDGSCFPSPIRGLARAACSIVMAAANGDPLKILRLPVPRHLPQTSQAAEHLGMAVAFEGALDPAVLAGDCSNVVNAYKEPVARALAATRKYAGLVLSSFKDLSKRRKVETRWVKAHRTATGEEDQQTAADIRGNAAADAAAREAAELHPAIPAGAQAEIDYFIKRAPLVVKAVAAALALFPRAPKGMERAPRPATQEEARQSRRHHWQFSAGAWRCSVCNDYSTRRVLPRYRIYQRCAGKGFDQGAADYARLGHAIVKADSAMPVLCCSRCGAWGNRRARNLGRPCAAPTKAGAQALRRIVQGLHPLRRFGTGSAADAQPSASISAAFDPARGVWVPIDSSKGLGRSESPMGACGLVQPLRAADGGGGYPDDAMDVEAPHDHEVDSHITVIDDDHGDPTLGGEVGEEDVFGHGGSLDQEAAGHSDDAPRHDMAVDVNAEDQPAVPPPITVVAPTAAAASRRRTRDDAFPEPRDLVAAAVRRLGESLRRADTDAPGRMARLRRRVRERVACSALGHELRSRSGAEEPAVGEHTIKRARGDDSGEEHPSSGEEARQRRAAAGPQGNPAAAKQRIGPRGAASPSAPSGPEPAANARQSSHDSAEGKDDVRHGATVAAFGDAECPLAPAPHQLPGGRAHVVQGPLRQPGSPRPARGAKRRHRETGDVSPEPSRRQQQKRGGLAGTRSSPHPPDLPPAPGVGCSSVSVDKRDNSDGGAPWGIGGAKAPEHLPEFGAGPGGEEDARGRDLGASATSHRGAAAAAAAPDATVARGGAIATAWEQPKPCGDALYASRSELLHWLRWGSGAAAVGGPPSRRELGDGEQPLVPREPPQPRQLGAAGAIRERRVGRDDLSLHAHDTIARAAAPPSASSEVSEIRGAGPAGGSIDAASGPTTSSPVRLSVPAGAAGSVTSSPPTLAESILPRRRVRGKQPAPGMPRRSGCDTAGCTGPITATAVEYADATTLTASRDERPPDASGPGT